MLVAISDLRVGSVLTFSPDLSHQLYHVGGISNDLTHHLLTCPLIAGSDTLVTAKNTEHFKRTINYYLTLAFD